MDKAVRTLLETDTMSRLKGMSQLGFTLYAFPSAKHTRFDHAIGVYYLTRLILKRIIDSGAYLADSDVRGSLAAALLHNVAEDDDEGTPVRNLTPTEHLLRDLLTGSLDANTLDCLVRDASETKVPYGMPDIETLIDTLRIVGQDNRAVLAVDEAGVGLLQALVFSRYLMYYNVYGHHALRVPTVMFLRAVQDAIQAEKVTSEELALQDDAGALALVLESADPESSSAVLVKRLTEHQPYKRALELDERHPSYASLILLRNDASWRRRIEEAWARYLTRYRKGTAGPFDILIDLPEREHFEVGLRLIRRSPLPGERNPVTWQSISGLSEEDMTRYHAPLHRVRIATANDALVTSVRRHADELFTIAEEVG